MSNPKFLRSLPQEAVQLVREYASDRVVPHPTAPLIKALRFEYLEEENRFGWECTKLSVSNGLFWMNHCWTSDRSQGLSDNRTFYLPHFCASGDDRYTNSSTFYSGFVLGRVIE